MTETRSRVNRFLRYAVIAIAIFGLLIAFTNLRKLKEHFLTMNLLYLGASLICSLAVYLLEGVFLKTSLQLFGERITIGRGLKYSLIINSLGYIVSLGGLTPFATQAYILGYSGISVKNATLTRIIQVIFFNLFFNLLLVTGFVFLIAGNEMHHFNTPLTIVVFCAFLALVTFLYVALFHKRFQRIVLKGVFGFIGKIVRVFSKKGVLEVSKALAYFDDFSKGFKNLLENPSLLLTLTAITVFDWLCWVGILYFSFHALRYSIHPGILIMGFSVGQIVAIASMVPGGAGTMEGSMALVFTLFGIPFEISFGAALLYRVTFFIIPFIISLPLNFSLRKQR